MSISRHGLVDCHFKFIVKGKYHTFKYFIEVGCLPQPQDEIEYQGKTFKCEARNFNVQDRILTIYGRFVS